MLPNIYTTSDQFIQERYEAVELQAEYDWDEAGAVPSYFASGSFAGGRDRDRPCAPSCRSVDRSRMLMSGHGCG